ncbi:MAG: Ig-like domain-containing protein [Flavobacteriaceae bacterium]
MHKFLNFILKFLSACLFIAVTLLIKNEELTLTELHNHHLERSPYKDTKHLSKKQRLEKGLPPDRFYEQIYELTIDPRTGAPNTQSKIEIERELEDAKSLPDPLAVPGDAEKPWYELGPNDAAGRSRAALWDLSDGGYQRVFAGGVSGGLWKNENITSNLSNWTRVTGVPGNLSVSIIIQDPDNTNVLYAGTGEKYTAGDASGNGIYKSTNGGTNWSLIFGRGTGTVTSTGGPPPGQTEVDGFFYVNDLVLWDHDKNPGTQKILLAALGSGGIRSRYMNSTFLDITSFGLYKSTNGGTSFSKITSVNNGVGISNLEEINDLDIQTVSNRLWMSTNRNIYGGSNGGRFWYSDDATTFTRATPNFPNLTGGIDATSYRRTEIAPSHIDTDTHYVLVQTTTTSATADSGGRLPLLFKTTDNFTNLTLLNTPDDVGTDMPDNDFTRGQHGYDLELEIDPTSNDIIYVGGINWHRSQNGGTSWSQISKWTTPWYGYGALNTSIVHADMHGLYFRPGNSNQAMVVGDGGVSYSSSLSTASNTANFIDNEGGMITTQFYTVAQSGDDFAGNDYVIGGTQDNGSYALINSNNNNTAGTETTGGDGAESVFDQVGGHYMINNYIYNNSIQRTAFDASGNQGATTDLSTSLSIPSNEGQFINPGALDSNQDVYFCNAGNALRVVTGLERGGTPATFTIPDIVNPANASDWITSIEVSRHTTESSTVFVGLKSGKVRKITQANSQAGHSVQGGNLHSQAGSVSDIHLGDSEDEIYVTYYNYGINNNIIYTDDQFATAGVNKEGDFPDIPVFSILNNPYESGEVVIGTELGVWRTTNFNGGSPSWTQSYNGMSDVAVYDMDFRGDSADNNRVVAASFGRGLYSSSFGSNTNPPVTVTDSVTLLEAGTATTTTGGSSNVLSNDTDPENDPLQAQLVSSPVNTSSFALQSSGTFTYVHNGSETTTDSFTYRAFDGAKQGNTVTVTIQITPVNDCPTVANPLADVNVSENASDTLVSIGNVFDDVDRVGGNPDNLSYTITQTGTDLATVTINTATITIDYIEDQNGSFVVTVTANDNAGCATTADGFNVNISSVNEAPITSVDSITLAEAGTTTITTAGSTNVLSNDSDPDGDNITAQVISTPINSSSFSLQTSGTFSYTHDGSETTTDSFAYRTFDGTDPGNTVTVTIQITPVNDCPTVSSPISDITVQEDSADTLINVSSVFEDIDRVGGIADNLSYSVTHTGSGIATVSLNTATITIDYIDDQTGSFVVTLTADDGAGCNTVNDVFNVTVNPQNDPPIGVADQIILNESATATTVTGGATSVLANDSDPESSPLTATLLTQPLHHNDPGNFALAANGTFSYIHNGSETATDTFFYTLSDGVNNVTVTVTVQINAVNDCPTVISAQPDINVNEDATNSVSNLNSIFGDVDIRPTPNNLTYTVTHTGSGIATVTLNSATLTIDYIENQTGSFVVSTTVNDNTGDASCSPLTSDVFSVTVNSQNDPPVTIGDELSVLEGGTVTVTTLGASSVLENDTDIEIGTPTAALLVTAPTFGTISLTNTGSFVYIHDGSETTSDIFTYKSNDGSQDGNTAAVSITITKVNDCPETTTGSYTLTYNEDVAIPTLNIGATVSDSDLPADTILYSRIQTNSSLSSVTVNNQGLVSFNNIAQHNNGSLTATVTVNDQNCQIYIPIYLTIVPVNDCPTLDNPIADINVAEDASPIVIDIRNTFSDVESPTLQYTAVAQNSDLIAVSVTSTSLIVQFKENQNGNTNITLTAFDGDSGCSPDDIISVNITDLNDPPTGNPDTISVVNGGTINTLNDGVTTSVLSNDTDPEGDSLNAQLSNGPLNGSLTLNANGTFTYTHDGSATTTDVFYYRPTDGFFPGNTTTVTIFINNPANGVSDTVFVMESGTATTTSNGSTSVLANDSDPDGDPITAIKVTNPSRGTVTLNANGTFLYTHDGSNESSDSFTYSANDGKINSAPITVSINVTGTNDPPVANNDTIIVDVGATATSLDNGQTRVTYNDIDPDADSLTVTLVSSPSYGNLTLNSNGTFSYVQGGTMNSGDTFQYKAYDGTVYSNNATVNIYISCSPCKESIVEGGNNGVSFTYTDPLCKKVRVYVPKGKAYSFRHLANSITINVGTYTLISSVDCN